MAHRIPRLREMAVELTALAEETTVLHQHQSAFLLTSAAAEADRSANLIAVDGSPAKSA